MNIFKPPQLEQGPHGFSGSFLDVKRKCAAWLRKNLCRDEPAFNEMTKVTAQKKGRRIRKGKQV